MVSLRAEPLSSWMMRMVYWIYFQMSSWCLRPFWTSGWFRKLTTFFILPKLVVSSDSLTWSQSRSRNSFLFSGILPLIVKMNSGKLMRLVHCSSKMVKIWSISVLVMSILCSFITCLNYS